MKYRILFIRHGMTKGNEEGRYIGNRTDEPLSDTGMTALKLKKGTCEAFTEEDSYLLFSSPLRRCVQSCHILFGNQHISLVDDLKEIDFGLFENKNYEELNGRDDYQNWIDSGGMADYPAGEKRAAFLDRNMRGFYSILKAMSEQQKRNAVIVCHGGTIMTILSKLTGGDYFAFQVKNGCGYAVDFEMRGDEISDVSYRSI